MFDKYFYFRGLKTGKKTFFAEKATGYADFANLNKKRARRQSATP